MLAALAAVAIPLIIEWLFRRRKRQVELPTLRFLLDNEEQENVRRQDRILLILRTIAIFFLVLALARPIIQRGWLRGGNRRNVLILLDTTASMQQQVDVTTAFGRAQKKAAGIIRGLPAGAQVAVVTLGDQAECRVDPTRDLFTAAAAVDALRPASGAAAMDKGLDKAREVAEAMGRCELYVFSDFQKQTWQPEQERARVGQLLDTLSASCEIFLVDVGGEPKFNYLVTQLRPTVAVISAAMPVQFAVTLKALGEVPAGQPARVIFSVDGTRQSVQEAMLGDKPVQLKFDYLFPKVGEYLVDVYVEGDEYLVDNRRWYLCSVPDVVRTLVLNEQSGSENADVWPLSLAIAPPTRPGMEKVSHFGVKTIPQAQMVYENLDEYALVVLTATPALDASLVNRLETYVNDGGALWMFMGAAVNVYDYNRYLYRKGGGLLPCRLAGAKQAPAGGLLPRFGESQHPALAELSDRGAIADAGVQQYFGVEEAPERGLVLALSNGEPLMLEKSYGQGRALLCTTTPGYAWTYLPAVQEFGVLVQELLRYLIGAPDRAVNLEVGGRFRQPLLISSEQPQIRLPDGRRESLIRRKERARKVELGVAAVNGAIRVSTAEQLAALPPAATASNQQSRAWLAAAIPETRFNHAGLENVLAAMGRQQQARIDVDWLALEEAGIVRTADITLIVRDIPLEDALREVLREAVGYSYFVEFDRTEQQGLYEVVRSIQGSQLPRQRFVVNPTEVESDLARLNEQQVATLFSGSRWVWVRPEEAVEEMAARLHTVIEIAPALLWFLVALLAVESYLAWQFGRRRGGVVS